MTKYMLISVCEREISTEQFDNFDDARKQMMEELEEELFRSDALYELAEFENVKDEDNCYDEKLAWNKVKSLDEYERSSDNNWAFGRSWAWSNADDDWRYDWKIVEIQ